MKNYVEDKVIIITGGTSTVSTFQTAHSSMS
jgi:hypothetical protein